MTLSQLRQALVEQLMEIEESYVIRYSLDATLYIRPTNGFGDCVTPVYPNGKEVKVVYATSPYRSIADFYGV